MKTFILLLLFVFFGLNNLTAQNHSEVYNSVYERYDFINSSGNLIGYRIWNEINQRWDYKDSNGNLYGYQAYNTVYERWDYTDLRKQDNQNNQSQQAGRYIVHDYGQVKSNFDANLALQLLAHKQAQYNSLSFEQRQAIARQKEFDKNYRWVNESLHHFLKKFDKKEKRLIKSILKESNILKREEKKQPKESSFNNLEDGVYELIFIKSNFLEQESVYRKRHVLIKNNKPIKFTTGFGIIYYVEDYTLRGDKLELKLFNKHDRLSETYSMYIPRQEPLKDFPASFESSKFTVYTKQNLDDKVTVHIYSIKGDFIASDKISKYVTSSSINCNTAIGEGFATFMLPPGKYKYIAFTNQKVWTNEIDINEGDCKSLTLTSN
ncbi:MAG: hypothetical protein WBA61_03630 [Aequorivita sp.]